MKLTKRQLKQIIKEEFGRVLSEETGLLFELSVRNSFPAKEATKSKKSSPEDAAFSRSILVVSEGTPWGGIGRPLAAREAQQDIVGGSDGLTLGMYKIKSN